MTYNRTKISFATAPIAALWGVFVKTPEGMLSIGEGQCVMTT